MLSNQEYVRNSLEFNLFFLRIAKEHAIFAAASLPPKDAILGTQLMAMKNNFEALLNEAVSMADGIISMDVLESGELVTEFTLPAEIKTQFLTGLPINTNVTRKELAVKPGKRILTVGALVDDISQLNSKAMELTKFAIAFLEKLMSNISQCQAFSFSYPSMLEHVIQESEFALLMFRKLEARDGLDSLKEVIEQEMFWNEIMYEHSKFIRGYLDPSEEKLFETANSFVKELNQLLEKTKRLQRRPEQLAKITGESINDVKQLRNFKVKSIEGILDCKIKSVIIPLLSDHVTREANHYLRMLRMFEKMV